LAVAAVVALLCLYACCCRKAQSQAEPRSVMRESILGTDLMPDTQLAKKDVGPRWAAGVAAAMDESVVADGFTMPRTASSADGTALVVLATESRRMRKGAAAVDVLVMFTDSHVSELRPRGWRATPLGRGGFGTVYRAKWRGREVAVKEIMLPTEPTTASAMAKQELKKRCALIAQDFVKEVEVCCDLHHPNLVKLMGYATKPQLIIVQELLLGNSLDYQLYTECWKPNRLQTLKVALDIARGMHYLHTAFERKLESSGGSCDQAIIHRDLKSSNLLLLNPPNLSSATDEWLLVKIADFGLSKDKSLDEARQTTKMTGCGSPLWMAPEIARGMHYNESVDVFSYAMCLLEVVDCQLPWSGCCAPRMVLHKVSQGERPEQQLERASAQLELAELIRRCWSAEAVARPAFAQIADELSELYRRESRDGHEEPVLY
jgi:hypothetical protein